jgi:beta-N-acetylhexosaminidase
VRRARSWVGIPCAIAAITVVTGCANGAADGGLPARQSLPPSSVPHRAAAGDRAGAPGNVDALGASVRGAAIPRGNAARDLAGQPVAAAPGSGPALPPLSARQLAGQRVIYSYSGLTPPARLLRRIRHGQAAGVVFFGGNIRSKPQLRRVVAELQQAAMSRQNPVREPLLMMTDQEGGIVRRLSGAPDLSEQQIGESADPAAAARRAGTGAGRNLRGAGINVNLAPVLDVYRRAGNFIDEFGRSYGRNAVAVATLGADFITAQQQAGVAATSKHFPGLGAASKSQDTDLRPVTLNLSRTTIQSVDELPYTAAIAAGVRLVMVSWAAYPNLGSGRPAGLSAAVVQGELRQRLDFTGVTITDALGAGALEHYGTIARRGVLAAAAGMDLLLCASQHAGEGIRALDGLAGGLRDGALSKGDFLASVQRVVALRTAEAW